MLSGFELYPRWVPLMLRYVQLLTNLFLRSTEGKDEIRRQTNKPPCTNFTRGGEMLLSRLLLFK